MSDLQITINGTPVPVYLGENTAEASRHAAIAVAWAQGTMPGGAGTKSAKEWAEVVATYSTILSMSLPSETGMVSVLLDSNKRILQWFGLDGTAYFSKLSVPNEAVGYSALATDVRAIIPPVEADVTFELLPSGTGMVAATIDQNRRVIQGIRRDGVIQSTVTTALSANEAGNAGARDSKAYTITYRSGDIYSIRKADGVVTRLTTSADCSEATLINAGTHVMYRSASVGDMYAPVGGGAAWPVEPSTAIDFYGDSMTATSVSPWLSWSNQLATALTGRTYTNYAAGGTTARQNAAKQGAQPALCTVTGNQIPASGAVNLTAISIRLLSVPGGSSAKTITGTLAGVAGTLTKNVGYYNSETDYGDSYTFTRTTAGSAVSCPANTPFIPDQSLTTRTRIVSLWAGVNDNYLGYTAEQISGSLIAMADYQATLRRRIIMISMINRSYEIKGNESYVKMQQVNAALSAYAAAHPADVAYIDIRSYVIANAAAIMAAAGIAPVTGDTDDINNDVIPRSLRQPSDNVHWITAVHTVLKDKVLAEITAKGW